MRYCLERQQMLLGLLMMVGAVLSTVFLIIALSSDHLIFCLEKQTEEASPQPVQDEQTYLSTNFGLWRACGQLTGHPMMKFVFVFLLLGLCVQVLGHIAFVLNRRYPAKNCFMFLTGTCYVFSGLSLLAGLVIFMGLVTEESMHQKPQTNGEVAHFRYEYGTSFLLLTASFCLEELSGILAVYLFIARYKTAYKKRHKRSHIIKSHSALLQDFLARKSSQTSPAEMQPNNDHEESIDNSSCLHTSNSKGLTKELSTHPWLPAKKQPQQYKEIVNSMSADSKLSECNGHSNAGMSRDQSHNEFALNQNKTSEKAELYNEQGKSLSLIASKGNILGSANSLSDQPNQSINFRDHNMNFGLSCHLHSTSEHIDSKPDIVNNTTLNLELIPPPPYFDPHPQTNTCTRKLTTTV